MLKILHEFEKIHSYSPFPYTLKANNTSAYNSEIQEGRLTCKLQAFERQFVTSAF